MAQPGDLIDHLIATKPKPEPRRYPRRFDWESVTPEVIDLLITSCEYRDSHLIWTGRMDGGTPAIFIGGMLINPVWVFFEYIEGPWHRDSGLLRSCDQPLCVWEKHYYVNFPEKEFMTPKSVAVGEK